MTDAIKALTDWLEKEPNATEVIIIRRRNNDFAVKIEYGDRTTIPRVNPDLGQALLEAVDKADCMPSSARTKAVKVSDHGRKSLPGINQPPIKLPGM